MADCSRRRLPIALAPAPGVQRVFRLAELRRLAARWHVEVRPNSEVCVERPVKPLDPARLLDAMQRQLPQARIEILDYSRTAAPEGELEFPLSGLRMTPAGGLWNGAVRYAGTRRFAVWAKVDVTVAEPRVVAAEDSADRAGRSKPRSCGSRLREASRPPSRSRHPSKRLRAESRAARSPPEPRSALACVEAAEGRCTRRYGPRGSPDRRGPPRNSKAVADPPAAAGETIPVLESRSDRRFRGARRRQRPGLGRRGR